MKLKPIIPREQANRDIEDAIDYYLSEGAADAALGFVDALETAYAQLQRFPASGSARYAGELGLPGLRSWPLKRYPHLIFDVEGGSEIDVWRVIDGHRDMPTWLHEPEP